MYMYMYITLHVCTYVMYKQLFQSVAAMSSCYLLMDIVGE